MEESENTEAENVTDYTKLLKAELPDVRIACLHGKMKPAEKNRIMEEFLNHDTDVLVSTTVIEVGVNVPNATVMLIEDAQRFGLAQLHQLRGRVGRGEALSYCFLICQSDSETAKERNRIMCRSSDGFEIAEADLRLRGPGEIFGTRQHGLPELHLSDLIRHGDVLEKAKEAAKKIIEEDPTLSKEKYQKLKERVKKMFGEEIKLEL